MTGLTRFALKNWRRLLASTALAVLTAAAAQTVSLPAHAADAAKGDPEAGKDVFRRCKTCHTVGPGARNRVGPILNDIIGRKAASVAGYAYSPAMKKAAEGGLTWTEEVLDKYLIKPRSFIKGTKMVFNGLPEAEDRRDLIAYLKTFSKAAKK